VERSGTKDLAESGTGTSSKLKNFASEKTA